MKAPQLKMTAREIMNPKAMAATRLAVARDIVIQLMSGAYSGFPVVDERDGQVIGVVTEFDLLKAVQEGKDFHTLTAEDIMSPVPICVEEDATVEQVIKTMTEQNIIRVPVVRKGKLVGIIARADILSRLIEPEFVRYPRSESK